MILKSILLKANFLGIISSALCLIHCLITPFIFITQCYSAQSNTNAPLWWNLIDLMFIIIAFFAIYVATKNTPNNYIKKGLWINWILVSVFIINEKVDYIQLPEIILYASTACLVILYIQNINLLTRKD